MIDMEPCDITSPTIISTQMRVALGMDVSHGLMTIMRSITTLHKEYSHKLKIIIVT